VILRCHRLAISLNDGTGKTIEIGCEIMSEKIQTTQATELLESAFKPLNCVAEAWDANYRIRYRIYDEAGNPLLSVDEITRPQFSDKRRFAAIIDKSREVLAKKGYQLELWDFTTQLKGTLR